jgi:hypothetical protein
MRVGEIEFEIECQEDQLQAAVDRILSTVTEKLKQTPLAITERAAAAATRRNMQKPNTKTMGRRLVLNSQKL